MGDLNGHLAAKHPEAPAAAGVSKLARFKSLTCRLMNPGRQPEAATKRQITRSKSPKLQSPQARRATGGMAARKWENYEWTSVLNTTNDYKHLLSGIATNNKANLN